MAKHRKPRRYYQPTPLKPELEISSSQEVELDETTAPGSQVVPDFIPYKGRGTSFITTEEDDQFNELPVSVKYQKRESIYYSITDSEIDVYAQLGWISNIFLTFFGASTGVCFACLLAQKQGNIPASAIVFFNTLGWATAIVSLIFLAFSILFIILQAKNKNKWKRVD